MVVNPAGDRSNGSKTATAAAAATNSTFLSALKKSDCAARFSPPQPVPLVASAVICPKSRRRGSFVPLPRLGLCVSASQIHLQIPVKNPGSKTLSANRSWSAPTCFLLRIQIHIHFVYSLLPGTIAFARASWHSLPCRTERCLYHNLGSLRGRKRSADRRQRRRPDSSSDQT